jgi:hypothetical protein
VSDELDRLLLETIDTARDYLPASLVYELEALAVDLSVAKATSLTSELISLIREKELSGIELDVCLRLLPVIVVFSEVAAARAELEKKEANAKAIMEQLLREDVAR